MVKSFNFRSQLGLGAMGVQIAKSVLRSRYDHIEDYADDVEMQRRGIDLYVKGLGYLEVKTDTHSPKRFFFELDVEGKPGAVDRCSADYYCIIFPESRVIYLIPRPDLQKWLRDNLQWLETDHKDWFKCTTSNERGRYWRATGVVVPKRLLMKSIKIDVIRWKEEDEVISAVWKKEEAA